MLLCAGIDFLVNPYFAATTYVGGKYDSNHFYVKSMNLCKNHMMHNDESKFIMNAINKIICLGEVSTPSRDQLS